MNIFEKVNKFHPDKVADRIAGAIVDYAYSQENSPKVAVEVLLGHTQAKIIVESSVQISKKVVQDIVTRIDPITTQVDLLVVPQDSHLAHNQEHEIRCGDNGIFCGVPTEFYEQYLTDLTLDLEKTYKSDGKLIIADDTITVCQSTMSASDNADVFNTIISDNPVITTVIINPLGYWTGGTDVDTGATNRKLGSDMGRAVSGGGLHGKDLSKADVSVNIYLYILAQKTGKSYKAKCSIGDTEVKVQDSQGETRLVNYADIVTVAAEYIDSLGGFEKFAEYGLIR